MREKQRRENRKTAGGACSLTLWKRPPDLIPPATVITPTPCLRSTAKAPSYCRPLGQVNTPHPSRRFASHCPAYWAPSAQLFTPTPWRMSSTHSPSYVSPCAAHEKRPSPWRFPPRNSPWAWATGGRKESARGGAPGANPTGH